MMRGFNLTNRKFAGLLLGLTVFSGIYLFADLKPGKPEVTETLAIAVLMAIFWITDALPMAVTALIPVALFPLLGVQDGTTVSSAYFNHIIFLFVGGFFMALAMEKWGLHRRLALWILVISGAGPGRVLLGFMGATAFLSMWMSNTATAMLMVPIAMSVIGELKGGLPETEGKKYGVGLLLGIAYSSSIGGIATLPGTPPNLSFARIFSILFPEAPGISFARWLIFAMPVSISMFISAWFILLLIFRPRARRVVAPGTFQNYLKELGKTRFEEWLVFIFFILLGFLWVFRMKIVLGPITIPGWSSLFQHATYINDGTVAILLAGLLFAIPSLQRPGDTILDWETARKMPWKIVLLFGGGFALAGAFAKSGLSLWFGEQMSGAVNLHPIALIFIVSLSISLLTELTSNTATTEMILPVLAGLAVHIHIDPLLLMVPATITASLAFILPVATPPNAIVFGSGLLQVKDMARAGFLLNIIGVIIVTLYTYYVGPALMNMEKDTFPPWAQKLEETGQPATR